jgi:hypothetical protein
MTTLKRLTAPPMPFRADAPLRQLWDCLAPQVCRWAPVTTLDLAALFMLVSTLALTLQAERELEAAASAPARGLLRQAIAEHAADVWEWSCEFGLGLEVLEELELPDGRMLADVLRPQERT